MQIEGRELVDGVLREEVHDLLEDTVGRKHAGRAGLHRHRLAFPTRTCPPRTGTVARAFAAVSAPLEARPALAFFGGIARAP